MRYELQIALRYLRARRKTVFISITTLFTAIGVTIGVAALAVVLSVMNGLEASLRDRVLSLSPQIQILSAVGSITDYPTIVQTVDRNPMVSGSDPFVNGQAILSSTHGASGVLIRGIDPSLPSSTRDLSRYIDRGSLTGLHENDHAPPAPNQPGVLILGSGLAEKLKANVGDRLRAVVPIMASGNSSELSTVTADFIVGGTFTSGVQFIDRNVAFAPLQRVQAFLGRVGKVDGIQVHLKDLDNTTQVASQLRHEFPYPYRVRDWMEFNQAATAGLQMLKKVYSLVLLLLIGVAAFNLVATLIMVVMEKRKDIAVLMAMGSSQRSVRMIFVLKGLVVGSLGTVGGLVLGGIGCFVLKHYHFIHLQKDIFGMSTVPIQVAPVQFISIAIASIVLCTAATFYPARQAARQMPVEIIRYE
jgi:lipoprotein-releasing system permease protein